MTPRPQSLAQLAQRTLDGAYFEYELADFLHEFQRQRDPLMLQDEPALLDNPVHNAYLAAVAVYLSGSSNATPPSWTRYPERILREPWFASPSRHLRAVLLVESPAAFRERNLFVSANALSVA